MCADVFQGFWASGPGMAGVDSSFLDSNLEVDLALGIRSHEQLDDFLKVVSSSTAGSRDKRDAVDFFKSFEPPAQ